MNNESSELVQDSSDLFNKIFDLQEIVNSSLFEKYEAHNKVLIEIQLKAMETYFTCLNARIDYLKQ